MLDMVTSDCMIEESSEPMLTLRVKNEKTLEHLAQDGCVSSFIQRAGGLATQAGKTRACLLPYRTRGHLSQNAPLSPCYQTSGVNDKQPARHCLTAKLGALILAGSGVTSERFGAKCEHGFYVFITNYLGRTSSHHV